MTEQILGSILEQKMLESLGYHLHPRTFKEIQPYLFREQDKFNYFPHRVVYTGAEHSGNPALGIPKLPNLTALPNLEIGRKIILGSTYGHTHCEDDSRPFQELYEFQGYGAMLLHEGQHRSNCESYHHQRARLHLLEKGDKITVGSSENMTILSFEQEGLVTLDFANPQRNKAHKELEKRLGTLLTITYELSQTYGPPTVTFQINENYIKEGIIKAAATQYNFEVHSIGSSWGSGLYDNIIRCQGHLEDLGIKVVKGGNISNQQKFAQPLLELARSQDEDLLTALGMK